MAAGGGGGERKKSGCLYSTKLSDHKKRQVQTATHVTRTAQRKRKGSKEDICDSTEEESEFQIGSIDGKLGPG